MNEKVEYPVRKDGRRDDESLSVSLASRNEPIDDKGSRRPEDRRDETVRVWHVIEKHRIGRRDPGDDAEFLDTEEDQRRPDHVEQLDGDEENPQWDVRSASLPGEADAVVADEQSFLPKDSVPRLYIESASRLRSGHQADHAQLG